MLDAHHPTEEELAFRDFRDKMPDAPYELLLEQHRRMESILEEIKAATDMVAAEAGASDVLKDLNPALAKMSELWHPHIQIEQEYVTAERVDALFSAEEQARMGAAYSQHSQQHSGPDYLVVPFLLYNLPVKDREIMSQAMPPVVTQQLVPTAWKEKWSDHASQIHPATISDQ